MAQKVRPVSDVSTSGWSPTPVYAEINEASPNDGSYVEASTSAAVFTVKLAPLAAPAVGPGASPLVLTVRIDGPSPVLVELLQGTALIASRVCDAPDGFANYTLTLTPQEAARIQYDPVPGSDPDLRVRVSAVSKSFAANETLPQTIPANDSLALTFTVDDLPTNSVPSRFPIVVAHGGAVGPLTLTLTDPNSTTINLFQELPDNTGTSTATGFRALLDDTAASGIQGVTQSSGTITGAYQPADPFSGFTGNPNGTWTATLTNSGGDTGSVTEIQLSFGAAAPTLVVAVAVVLTALEVELSATITGGTAYLVSIDWGDGSDVGWFDPTDFPVTHAFLAADTYVIIVRAYGDLGKVGEGSVVVSLGSEDYCVTDLPDWPTGLALERVGPTSWEGGDGVLWTTGADSWAFRSDGSSWAASGWNGAGCKTFEKTGGSNPADEITVCAGVCP